MNCIAITNQKGGVAKTTTAVNLSAGLHNLGKKVLLIDSDPQANATSHLGFSGAELNKTLDNLYYEDELKAEETILSRDGLSIIAAGEPLAYAEQKLSGIPAKENILKERIAQIRDQYDYIIIDCPPNLGFLTMNAFAAATDMLVVIKPEYFALEGLKRISKIAELVQKRLNPELTLSGYLLANFDARKKQHKQIRQSIKKAFPDRVLQTVIRTHANLSNCTAKGQTIFEYDPKCYGAIDYKNLAEEVIQHYG
jgi:chromosome partitioning protein